MKVARELPESSLRVLKRIADQMRDGFTGRVELDLNQGGVRDFREVRSWRPADLEESDSAARDLTPTRRPA